MFFVRLFLYFVRLFLYPLFRASDAMNSINIVTDDVRIFKNSFKVLATIGFGFPSIGYRFSIAVAHN